MRAISAITMLLCASTAFAEISIDELVRDAGIREGSVAVSEMPRWRGARKIIVARLASDEVEALRASMPDTEFVVAASESEAIGQAAEADAILGLCSDRLLSAAPRLVWVQIFSSGAERCLKVPAVASGEVTLTNMQKMSAPVIGEHTVALMLALARGLPSYAKGMHEGGWMRQPEVTSLMFPVSGKTMLVVGLGGIGTEVAKRGSALGMRVLATRNSSREAPPFVDYVGLSDELPELLGRADVIVNALPMTDATREIFNAETFGLAKPGALFINVGRGGTVDTRALTAALQSGHIRGAGLDVTSPEPLPPEHPLWQMSNVIITPHVAARGGGRERHAALRKENLRRYAAGEPLLNVVDPARGY